LIDEAMEKEGRNKMHKSVNSPGDQTLAVRKTLKNAHNETIADLARAYHAAYANYKVMEQSETAGFMAYLDARTESEKARIALFEAIDRENKG
jgi:hypothetical protein